MLQRELNPNIDTDGDGVYDDYDDHPKDRSRQYDPPEFRNADRLTSPINKRLYPPPEFKNDPRGDNDGEKKGSALEM